MSGSKSKELGINKGKDGENKEQAALSLSWESNRANSNGTKQPQVFQQQP